MLKLLEIITKVSFDYISNPKYRIFSFLIITLPLIHHARREQSNSQNFHKQQPQPQLNLLPPPSPAIAILAFRSQYPAPSKYQPPKHNDAAQDHHIKHKVMVTSAPPTTQASEKYCRVFQLLRCIVME